MDFLKNHHHRHHSSTNNSHRSISDTDSQLDEFHSPLRANSPHLSDLSITTTTSTAIVNFRSPLSSTTTPPFNVAPIAKSKNPEVAGDGGGGVWRVVRGKSGGKVGLGLGFRVVEMVVSLVAFSVMASDKTDGWSGDSFDRYREYRYLVAVNAIAFTYAAFQAIDLTYHLVYEKHIVAYTLRSHFDFLIDQILAYLLISSSSSAATRVEDWVLNWGKDDFTKKASASIAMSFLAFLGFAFSSLISGYNLCDQSPI